MRGWWQCPSGLGSDARWRALSLAARGLLATLADAADGTGEVIVGRLPLAAVLRGMAPGEASEAREALWSELTAAGLVDLDGPVILVTLPGGVPVARAKAVRGDDGAECVEAPGAPQDGVRDGVPGPALLRAWSSRYGLKTSEARAAWASGAGALKVAKVDRDTLATWIASAGRRGGTFGKDRQPKRGDGCSTPPGNGCDGCSTDGGNGCSATTVDSCDDGCNTPSPSHSPSERKTEKQGESARPHGGNANGSNGGNVTTVDGCSTDGSNGGNTPKPYDRDGVETALVSASGGKVDLMSAPAHLLRDLHRVMGEMRVTPALARVMGELARDPAAMWKRATPVRRVTPQFLLGWVEGNGERDARALSELVAAAREKVSAARTLRAVPTPPPLDAPPPTEEELAAARVRHAAFLDKLKAQSAARKLQATLEGDAAAEAAAEAARRGRAVGQA